MVTAGLTPMQALLASTSTAATACGVDGQVGSIQAGKGADIVIVAGSPLDDIRAVSDVLAVYKDGALVRATPPRTTAVSPTGWRQYCATTSADMAAGTQDCRPWSTVLWP